MIRIYTAAASVVGPCDHCSEVSESTQVITVMTLHRGEAIVFVARFCEKHFLQFSDLISDQVATLLYPKVKTKSC